MAKTMKLAPATDVREWAEANNYEVAARGRFNSDLIRAFNNDRDNKRRGIYYEPVARDGGTAPAASNTPAPAKRAAAAAGSTRGANRAQVQVIDSSEVADAIPGNVLEMLRAASKGGGGHGQAVVSIHALVDI